MLLNEQLADYVRACFTGIWIESHEHQDALSEIAALCRQEDWQLGHWNLADGLQMVGTETADAGNTIDPLSAIRAVSSLATPNGTAILVLQNFHRFLQSAEIVQALARQVLVGKQNRTIVVILAPVVTLPVELEKLFVVLEHARPDRRQLTDIARSLATADELPTGDDFERVLDAAAGLTRYEAESAISLSLVRDGRVRAETLWEQKAQLLKKSGLLKLYRGDEDFAGLGGLAALKSFCQRSLSSPGRSNPLTRARGVLLLGIPGTGKSGFAKALGRETGRPTLMLDVGALFGSLVGQTEQNIRQALQIADAMAPCVLFVDELEKALSGIGSAGPSDSGVSGRLFGTVLQWMQDHTSDVYVIATCNDIRKLPPELSRAGRFDAVVFLDLPTREEKDAIWSLYESQFGIPAGQSRPDDEQFTGAEIRACCRLAALLDVSLSEAAGHVVPVAVTAAESVEQLRAWASGRCLDASRPGLYQAPSARNTSRRRLNRNPTAN